jgi:hypothetical protein
MTVLEKAVPVRFPLEGEWAALNTPAERIPSHGTDYFGQRYAYDLVKVNGAGTGLYELPSWRHVFGLIPAESFLAYGQPVLAAFEGKVVGVGDGWPDRKWVNAIWELLRATFFVRAPKSNDYRSLLGNYILVEGSLGVALYAHLKEGSVRTKLGEIVAEGQRIALVGNSGNSTMPHLHFHVMNMVDPKNADGILCGFKDYDRLVNGAWERVAAGVPALMERIRVL